MKFLNMLLNYILFQGVFFMFTRMIMIRGFFLVESMKFLGLEIGSWADWIGIVVTFLTIFLTIRYYNNDNKKISK